MSHTTVPIRESSQLAVLTARVVVYGADAEPRVVVLRSRSAWTIGRDVELADIVIHDSSISKRHVQIERGKSPSSWMLTDLHSTNGTRVNGRRVSTAILRSNDVIRLGSSLLVFELAEWTEEGESTTRSYMGHWLEQQVSELATRWHPLLVMGEGGTGKGEFCRAMASALKVDRMERVACALADVDSLRAVVADLQASAPAAAPARMLLVFQDIHTLSPALQQVLSHLLDALYGAGTEASPIHLVATSSVVLDELVVQGKFSRKLYGRIAGIAVTLPPLSERRMDILPAVANALGHGDHRALHPDVAETLLVYSWPGNFAELMTTCASLRGAPSLSNQRKALPRLLREFRQALDEAQTPSPVRALADTLNAATDEARNGVPSYETLKEELARANYNVSQLARNLGEHRNQVVRWLDRYELRPVRR